MSDPKRWRETEGEEVVMLVGELAKVEPTQAIKESVWAKIALTLPPGPGSGSPEGGAGSGGDAGGGAGAGAAPGAGLGAKAMVPMIAAAAVASAVAIWLISTTASQPKSLSAGAPTTRADAESVGTIASAPPSPPSPSAAPSLPVAPSAAVGEPDAVPVTPAAERPPVIAKAARAAGSGVASTRASASAPTPSSVTSAPPAAADRLREEAEGVQRAQQLLRARNAAGALAELDRLARLVPNGPLEEEREVLTIEGLAASGSMDAARRRADRFLFERPQSAHAPRVRALTGR